MSVPVYFNEPTSITQNAAITLEYNHLLDQASIEPDSMKRLALIAAHQITVFTCLEKTVSKPFNPLLGETYELKTDTYEYIAEQVSHHPPITAVHCQGKHYKYFTNCKANTNFTGRTL